MKEWAEGQGIPAANVITISDEEGTTEVTTDRIKRAIRDLPAPGVLEQLMVHFAGHGVNIGFNEYRLLTDARVQELMNQLVNERGPLNKGWVLAVLRAIDNYMPRLGSQVLALFTHDVDQYLRNPGIRDTIETGVRAAFERAVPTVVVAHSCRCWSRSARRSASRPCGGVSRRSGIRSA